MKNLLRIARAATSAARIVRNPSRLDEVFQLADALADSKILQAMAESLAKDPGAARSFVDMPRIGTVDLAELRKLPKHTLGRAFAEHMITNGLNPSALPSMNARDRESFLRAHLYETHDVWHVVTGFTTDVPGELGLQAFYLAQFPARLSTALVALGLLNVLLFRFEECDERMRAIVRGWLLGKRAKPLFGARWADMWATPLEDVRRAFGIDITSLEAALTVAA